MLTSNVQLDSTCYIRDLTPTHKLSAMIGSVKAVCHI